MASDLQMSIDEYVKRPEIRCHVCLSNYQSEGINTPMSLQCGHSCCLDCIVQLKTFKCPDCQAPFVPTAIQSNWQLIDIINQLPQIPSNTDQKFVIQRYADIANWYFEHDWLKYPKWMKRAADQGHVEAQARIAVFYYLHKKYDLSFHYFKLAAEQGYMRSQFHLGSCYEHGRGIECDKNMAIQWYIKAAEQGEPDAIEKLKVMSDDK